jgi:peptide deformylase
VIKLVSAPNPVLSEIAKPVIGVDSSVTGLISQMKKILLATTDPKGVGLAAPQVGQSLRIFLAKPTDRSEIMVFINPKITHISLKKGYLEKEKKNPSAGGDGKSEKLEGCLSLPNIWGPVLRSPTLTVEFMDEKGVKHKQKFKGFMATIIQHETDHLNGILFPKRVLEQSGTLYKSHKNKKGEDEFEEIEI